MLQDKYIISEVTSNDEWLILTGQIRSSSSGLNNIPRVQNNQVLLVDIFPAWGGPCLAVESHLRKMRHSGLPNPEALALARACSDAIEDLKDFRSDPRPTFLFWARGGPVALLRGANRPLLTRLVLEQVDLEYHQKPRLPCSIDFKSDRVIQCEGDLALLAEDAVVHSIGTGETQLLTCFFDMVNDPEAAGSKSPAQSPRPPEENGEEEETEEKTKEEDEVNDNETNEENADGEESELMEQEENGEEEEEEEDEEEEGENETKLENGEPPNAFGTKVRKKKKKLETGLLKEILGSSRRR